MRREQTADGTYSRQWKISASTSNIIYNTVHNGCQCEFRVKFFIHLNLMSLIIISNIVSHKMRLCLNINKIDVFAVA